MAPEYVGICYSGYRRGQSPDAGVYPTPAQIREDLLLIAPHWRRLRLYDAGPHAELVLAAITDLGLDVEVMLGAFLAAEVNNPGCPWGGVYPDAQLAANRAANEAEIARTIDLARRYPRVVTAVAAGNEATVSWTDHLVPVPRLAGYLRQLKAALPQPLTTCENHVPWIDHLAPLADHLDFVSVHTYPVWEYRTIDEALAATIADYERVAAKWPDRPVVITEAGWTTRSNGRGIAPQHASTALQARYVHELAAWCERAGVLTYLFEAFDEPWKGSPDPDEPEKHWGLFTEDRRPKPVMYDRTLELRP